MWCRSGTLQTTSLVEESFCRLWILRRDTPIRRRQIHGRRRALSLQSQRSRDKHQLHFRGALTNLEHLAVAVMTRHRIFVHKAVSAVYLGGIAGVVHRRLRGDHLRDRRLLLEGLARQHLCGGIIVRCAGNMGACLHPRDLEADRLISADRLAKRLTLVGVLDALVNTALRRAGGQRCNRNPALVQDGQEVGIAAPRAPSRFSSGPAHRQMSVGGCPRRSSRPCYRPVPR